MDPTHTTLKFPKEREDGEEKKAVERWWWWWCGWKTRRNQDGNVAEDLGRGERLVVVMGSRTITEIDHYVRECSE